MEKFVTCIQKHEGVKPLRICSVFWLCRFRNDAANLRCGIRRERMRLPCSCVYIIGRGALRQRVNPKRIQWRAHGRRHTVGTGRKGSTRKYDRSECQSSSRHIRSLFSSQFVICGCCTSMATFIISSSGPSRKRIRQIPGQSRLSFHMSSVFSGTS